ncbi:heme-dependent oxidative N-demethylase subunit alpha family protein [Candidatus Poriferisodalis sp.]|uniref:heme-dependent oxidative N-demethylase subunit alpha family protein n=2 Tax=Candidatus Poriferisodalis sp. TaxID=3101277 RepID=UPI003AF53D9F
MIPVDPHAYPIDIERYRNADLRWLDELDRVSVHAGVPYQRMGTRGIEEADWLRADELRASELALKRRLHDEAHGEVFAALPGSEGSCAEASGLVHDWLARHLPEALSEWDDTIAPPLARAGLAIQEDLCVMEQADGGWRLTAGLVGFPTYWATRRQARPTPGGRPRTRPPL